MLTDGEIKDIIQAQQETFPIPDEWDDIKWERAVAYAQEKDTLKKICDLLWDLLEASKSPSPSAIPIKLQTILEALKRGEMPEMGNDET